ncbi:zinc-dependent alcohol dehydrogenase family protein [Novosphingobium malaysiense]|uniref:zinc-dependent alcohol dehydrogenase family protein n=1 Tax=Novosphingobium malaysiense TaxID=1348853 RepID=UPI002F422C44
MDVAEPPAPAADEIQVRLHASSLNFHDYSVAAGLAPRRAGLIPLSDGAGEVVAIGADVEEFSVGDTVISTFFPKPPMSGDFTTIFKNVPGDGLDGFACEMVTAPAANFTRAPQGWSYAEAATVPCAGLTAWRALVADGQLRAGQTVLVQGTGGVSIYALQIAKALGCRVIATSSSAAKIERLLTLGADQVINYRDMPDWGVQARALTGGRGVDHVVEIGGGGTLAQSIQACAMNGHIAVIGSLAGYSGQIPTATILARQIRLIGLLVGSPAQQSEFVAALETTGIRPVIDSRFPLSALADGFRRQESGAHFGKIVIDI